MKELWSCFFILSALVGLSLACTDGDTSSIEGVCHEYSVCKNGEWTKESCFSRLRKYSKEEKKCKWWFQVDCQEANQCETENELFKHPSSTCSSYYECINKKLVLKTCPATFYFDGTSCKFLATCPNAVTEKEKYADPCEGNASEPIANHCFWYKTCGSDGFFQSARCPLLKYFNTTTKTCDWFWRVNCDVSKCDGKPRMAQNSDGKDYYQCTNGYLLKQSCESMKKFNPDSGRCEFSFRSYVKLSRNSTSASSNSSLVGARPFNTTAQVNNQTQQRLVRRWVPSVMVSPVSAKTEKCNSGTTKVNKDCFKFDLCVDGQWTTKRCPMDMIYSADQCRFEVDAQCQNGSCIAGTKAVYAKDCTKYVLCDTTNTQVVESCGTNTFFKKWYFNPNTLACTYSIFSQC